MKQSLLFIFISLILFPASLVFSSTLSLQKGPSLHLREGRFLVIVQKKGLEAPEVEWRRGKETGRVPLKKGRKNVWSASLVEVGEKRGYSYRIIDGEKETDWIPIRTHLKKSKGFTFAIYGDNREGWGDEVVHRNIVKLIDKDRPDLVLHTGDMVKRGGDPKVWDDFFGSTQFLYESTPFQPAVGNHDLSKRDYYADFFPLGEKRKSYYAFRYGGALFIALDTTIDFARKSPQYKFLKKTLSEAQGLSPIFVYFHHPPFSSAHHGSDFRVRKYLVPLFEDYGVDIVFSGHEHSYQRVGPVNGVLYIVTAGGGAPLYQVDPEEEHEGYKVLYHYILVKVQGNQVKGWMKNTMGVVEDKFNIDHGRNPVPEGKREALPDM